MFKPSDGPPNPRFPLFKAVFEPISPPKLVALGLVTVISLFKTIAPFGPCRISLLSCLSTPPSIPLSLPTPV